MRVSVYAALLFTAGLAAAQPIDSQHHTRPDLRIVKTVATAPQGTAPAVFDIVVTNVGTTGSGPFTVTDVLTPPAFFDPSILAAQPPWVCATFPTVNPTYLTCTHPGPLSIGNSVVLQVQVQTPNPGEFENCASVSCDGDPNEENNEDCACTDFKPCQPVSIDISTGSANGVQLSAGTPDPDWELVQAPAPVVAPALATTTTPPSPPWVTSTTAQWISGGDPPSTATAIPYVYEFHFVLGHEMVGRNCSLEFQYAADNDVSIELDATPIASLSGSATSNFTTLHPQFFPFVGSFGQHTLQATVTNAGGPSGLLVVGSLRCSCEAATPLP